MTNTDRERQYALEVSESRLILQLPKVADAQLRLAKILARGYMDSDMTAAIVELRSAADNIEAIQKEWPK